MARTQPRKVVRPDDQEAVVDVVQDRAQPAQRATQTGSDYVERNRAAWDRWAPGYLASGRKAWQEVDLHWGIWGVPESELKLLGDIEPGDDIVELGAGTAEVSAWLARRGARPVAVDVSSRQVRNVELLQREFQLSFPVICTNAEEMHYEDESFDGAISDFGASLWCDPQRWLPEAHRVLRPGGLLTFFTTSDLLMVCTPEGGGRAGERLVRDFFSHSRMELEEDGAVEFHSTHGNWIRHLRSSGFVIENLIEVRPGSDATPRYDLVTLEWARHWPSEEIWIARKA